MRLRRFVCLTLLLCGSWHAFGALTVWGESKPSANQIIGKVVSIGTLENGTIVRIAGKDQTESFHVCQNDPGVDASSLKETTRKAFEHGDVVIASYTNPYDRCLAHVEIRKDEKAEKKTPTAIVTRARAPQGT